MTELLAHRLPADEAGVMVSPPDCKKGVTFTGFNCGKVKTGYCMMIQLSPSRFAPFLAILILVLSGCSGGSSSPLPTVAASVEPSPPTVQSAPILESPTPENAGIEIVAQGTVQPPTPQPVDLPNLGAAPELTNDVWINSQPLQLADLQGKVVLIEFWTYT